MKVSLRNIDYLNQQYKTGYDPYQLSLDELLRRIGAQLGAVEEVTNWGQRYDKIVVAKVMTCIQHPNADKLHVVTLDDGGITPAVKRDAKGYVEVVCGAPNVREGLVVAWLPPGSTVPSSYGKDPFVLGARELRGVVSNGMLASPKELGMSDDHEGILEIKQEDVGQDFIKPGTPFKNLYGLDDIIIDCENKMFTHRPDCFGTLGVARELAGIEGQQFKSPDWYTGQAHFDVSQSTANAQVSVQVEIPELVPAYMLIAVDNITVAPSPIWLQAYLSRVGIRPINNIVDVTNYMMMLTGQPLHAFDFDKVAVNGNAQIIVRKPKSGETLTLLDGKTIEPHKDAIVICDAQKPIGLAGVMGGKNSEIDETTTRVLIECAVFDMYSIRRTSMEHGIFTDAVTRYTKGQSPWQCPAVLAKTVAMLSELSPGAKPVNEPVLAMHGTTQNKPVTVNAAFMNERLGAQLTAPEITQLLENVEFKVNSEPNELVGLNITAPFWRTDIVIPEDIVEEVGRLYGYDKLPVVLPTRTARPVARNRMLDFKRETSVALAAAGANEVLSYSFVHGDLLRKTGTDPDKTAYHIRNAISPDLQYYRTALMPSLLDKVRGNVRADIIRGDDNDFALFEVGKAHVKGELNDEGLPAESERLALVFVADQKTAQRKYPGSAFYQAKHYLLTLVATPLEFVPLTDNNDPMAACYQVGRSAVIMQNKHIIGVIGEYNPLVKKALKLPDFSAGFELDLEAAVALPQMSPYSPIGIFPKTQADLTLEVNQSVAFAQVFNTLQLALQGAATEHGYDSVIVPRDIFQAEGSPNKRITFRIWLSHKARTLKTQEVNNLLDTAVSNVSESLDAIRI